MPPLAAAIESLSFYTYILLFMLAVVEGPNIMILTGFFVGLGYISFLPAYLALMAGDFTGDICWYWIGRHGAKRTIVKYGRFLNITTKNINTVERLFEKHPGKILFFSKITMGFGFALAVILSAGMSRVPFKKFVLFTLPGQIIWTATLMAIGYMFGGFYSTLNRELQLISFISFGIIILLGMYGMNKYFRKRSMEKKL